MSIGEQRKTIEYPFAGIAPRFDAALLLVRDAGAASDRPHRGLSLEMMSLCTDVVLFVFLALPPFFFFFLVQFFSGILDLGFFFLLLCVLIFQPTSVAF